jgi:agmatinase
MTAAYSELLGRRKPEHSSLKFPKLVTLGGDHSIALPVLRALNHRYGEPISVLHFDAHLDTWAPSAYPGSAWDPEGEQQAFNHGSMFWLAGKEALIARNSSVHAGLRARLTGEGWGDFEDDEKQGWMRIVCDEIDKISVKGIVKRIMKKMGTTRKVYLSVDIDVVDPGLAPSIGNMSDPRS